MGEPYHWYDSPTSTLQVVEVSMQPPLGSGIWLSGHGVPPSGSGMLPLDGVNDPWRWAGPMFGAWIGPAYHVTVAADASFLTDHVLQKSGSMAELDLYLTTATVLRDVTAIENALFKRTYKDPGTYGPGQPVGSVNYQVDLPPEEAGYVYEAVTATDGIAFLVQSEADYGGPTAVPDATVDTVAALEALGALTVGDPFVFSETTPIGLPGQFYLDVDTRDVYLRSGETWAKVSTLPAPA